MDVNNHTKGMNTKSSIKDRMKLLRETLGLTQSEFGERIGVTRDAIAAYERGVTVKEPIIRLICKEFNIDYSWLAEGTDTDMSTTMSSSNSRVKEVRMALNLSQKSFGEKLGMKTSSISTIEKGVNNLTNIVANLICKTYNVNYLWLTEGKGEMFETPDTALDDLIMQYDLNEVDTFLIKAYLNMSKEERAEFAEVILNKLLTILKQELHTDQKH